MSLELAINELTAAVKQLTVVMTTAAEADEPTSGAAEPGKRTRRTKAQIEADNAAAAAGKSEHLVEGDPAGTRYWNIAPHNTVYRQLPGEPDCAVAGAAIITGSEYLKLKGEYAAKFPTGAQGQQSAAPAPAPASSTPAASPASSPSPAASPAVTMQSITSKLQALHKRDGNAGVKKVLDQFGVPNVPGLAGKDLAAVDAAVEAILNPQTSDNLFG